MKFKYKYTPLNFTFLVMEQKTVSKSFEEAFTHFYYLMFSADKVADMRELQLGSAIMELEGMDKPGIMQEIDFLSQLHRDDVYESGLDAFHQSSEEEQLRCLAYMRMIARVDGSIANRELDLIQRICQDEAKKDLYDVLKLEETLTHHIQSILDQHK